MDLLCIIFTTFQENTGNQGEGRSLLKAHIRKADPRRTPTTRHPKAHDLQFLCPLPCLMQQPLPIHLCPLWSFPSDSIISSSLRGYRMQTLHVLLWPKSPGSRSDGCRQRWATCAPPTQPDKHMDITIKLPASTHIEHLSCLIFENLCTSPRASETKPGSILIVKMGQSSRDMCSSSLVVRYKASSDLAEWK